MNEYQAKTKWCPMVRFIIGSDNATWQNIAYTNRSQELNKAATCCLGSDCAIWVKDGEIGRRPNGQIVKKDTTGDVTWIENGHCGLIK